MNLSPALTLGIPALHASFATENFVHGVKAAIAVWKALRTFDTILLAALVATLFKASTQTNVVLWFFVSSSIIQAVMGLVCSTILIIFFADYREHEHRPVDVAELRFLIWTVWHLFSFPAIWTAWSTITFVIALVVDIVRPNAVQNPSQGTTQNNSTSAAQLILYMLICVAVALFVFFMLHLRRLSQNLGRAA